MEGEEDVLQVVVLAQENWKGSEKEETCGEGERIGERVWQEDVKRGLTALRDRCMNSTVDEMDILS